MGSIPPPLQPEDQVDLSRDDSLAMPSDLKSEFKCGQCGAKLTFAPGTLALKCHYCDHHNDIPQSEQAIEELDFHAYLQQTQKDQALQERLVVKCSSCGAESDSEVNVVSQNCAFCDSAIITSAQSVKQIKPRSLLPFKITQSQAKQSYQDWLKGLWFAPHALKQRARLDVAVQGIYVPHWTFDADTLSYYTGQRGVYYYVTVTRTRTSSEGKSETYTTRERRTRWYPVSGTVAEDFDDLLVNASRTLPEKYVRALEPWDLQNLKSYQDQYLSGFKTESYQVNLEQGFEVAKDLMNDAIQESVRRHIGGDEQRIFSLKTQHNQVTFKHILLPVWLSAYRYQKKVYRFMVNARTGEVQGERPWSWVKITLAVLGVVGLAAGGYFGYEYYGQLR